MNQPDDLTQLYSKLGLIGRAWTPSAPIQSEELFAGRLQQLERVLETVFDSGQHGVLFGERGVGKTSLANVIVAKFGAGMTCLRVACDSDDTFDTVWDRVLARIPVDFIQQPVGYDRGSDQLTFSLASLPGARGDKAAELADFLVDNGAKGLVIIDEYDRLSDGASKRRMADLLKNLSDRHADITILLVGVADNIGELIGQHPSVERCLRQVRLPRMSEPELLQIVRNGCKVAEMSFTPSVARAIVESSRGFPHYTHLLAKHSASVAAHSRRDRIVTSDFRTGAEAAIQDAQASIRDQFSQATTSTKPSLFRSVIMACALAPEDEHGTFRPKDVERPLEAIVGRAVAMKSFFPHLTKLCSAERAQILTRVGPRKRYRYRFTNPLMKPFVVLVSRRDGVDVDRILTFSEPQPLTEAALTLE